MKRVDETKAGKAISAFVILKKGKLIAKIQAHYSDAGNVLVNAWDWSDPKETNYFEGKAGGYGYDKFTRALVGFKVDGHAITDHCAVRLKPKNGKFFPKDFKTPKGYNLANGYYAGKDGVKVSEVCLYNEHGGFEKKLFVYGDCTGHEYRSNPDHFPLVEDQDLQWVYSSCFKDSGLDYLRAVGYEVIQVI